VLAIESRLPLEGELMSFYVDEALVVMGASLRGALVTLIMRGNRLIPRRGSTVLKSGGHAYVLAQP